MSLSVPVCLVKNTRYIIDVPSVVELYRVHSVDIYMYRVHYLHSIQIVHSIQLYILIVHQHLYRDAKHL
jgi:hypothetical protein